MKKNNTAISAIVLSLVFFVFALSSCGEDKEKRPSPPARASGKAGSVNITVDYSSPKVKQRAIWGELVPYDKVWRTGANEATYVEFDGDVLIGGKELKAGKYSLFSIPTNGEWTVIFNKEWEQWGAYEYKADQDALRTKATPSLGQPMAESLTFEVASEGEKAANITLRWEKLSLTFKVETK